MKKKTKDQEIMDIIQSLKTANENTEYWINAWDKQLNCTIWLAITLGIIVIFFITHIVTSSIDEEYNTYKLNKLECYERSLDPKNCLILVKNPLYD